jgi:hypothetical protein
MMNGILRKFPEWDEVAVPYNRQYVRDVTVAHMLVVVFAGELPVTVLVPQLTLVAVRTMAQIPPLAFERSFRGCTL